MPAGPSEVEVLADESANAAFIASDLLSQAEHGVDSQVILVTNSRELIPQVKEELQNQLQVLPRKEIAEKALLNSRIILLNTVEEMIRITSYNVCYTKLLRSRRRARTIDLRTLHLPPRNRIAERPSGRRAIVAARS